MTIPVLSKLVMVAIVLLLGGCATTTSGSPPPLTELTAAERIRIAQAREAGEDVAPFDTDRDGRNDLWKFYRNGRLLRKEFDTDRDGAVDWWRYYDERERLVRDSRDTDRDGVPDLTTWYEAGKRARSERL